MQHHSIPVGYQQPILLPLPLQQQKCQGPRCVRFDDKFWIRGLLRFGWWCSSELLWSQRQKLDTAEDHSQSL